MGKIIELVRDKNFLRETFTLPSIIFSVNTTILTFIELGKSQKICIFLSLILLCVGYIIFYVIRNANLKEITLVIDGSKVNIKEGDIFDYSDKHFKVIAFNEYFDTTVDDKIINKTSLNGQYINRYYDDSLKLDGLIESDIRLKSKIKEMNVLRPLGGKTTRYKLGTIYPIEDYFLVAFSRFNDENEAVLKLSEYANCLINFWNEVNTLYSQKEVIIPLLGTGITRHKDFVATDQQLLEVMLWTFQISKVKFKEPSEITILLHGSTAQNINYFKLKEFEKNGI